MIVMVSAHACAIRRFDAKTFYRLQEAPKILGFICLVELFVFSSFAASADWNGEACPLWSKGLTKLVDDTGLGATNEKV